MAEALVEILEGASVELRYCPADHPEHPPVVGPGTASATGPGPDGWQLTVTVRLGERIAPLVGPEDTPLLQILGALPAAGIQAAARFRPARPSGAALLSPAMRRALRDMVVIEALGQHQSSAFERLASTELIGEVVEYLIELSGNRVEAMDLTHGVVITDALVDEPRLRFAYPRDLKAAKRAPLLFDGQSSVLIVDREGLARTELQRHRFDRLVPGASPMAPVAEGFVESGALVAAATRRLGGIGFYLRSDNTLWAFVDGQALVMRRGEHWTAFPVELAAALSHLIGGAAAAQLVVQAALMVSAQQKGAILAIVDDPSALEGIVSDKDRFDLRNEFDPLAMRPETRLHHLIDATDLDEVTLARLAALDGATIVDRDARLLAYGAIVHSADSEHEGARTAAAKTLSASAAVVLKVSQDGDITVFHEGRELANLLGSGTTGQ